MHLSNIRSFFLVSLLFAIPLAAFAESEKPKLIEAIVVNLQGPERKYLQVEMAIRPADMEMGERIKTYMPAIRNELILLLAGKDVQQLAPIEGKQQLLRESRSAINHAMGLSDKKGIKEVSFTSFIIQ